MNHQNLQDRLKTRLGGKKRKRERSAFAGKLTGMILLATMAAIALSTIVCVYALRRVHDEAKNESISFGMDAMSKSREALLASFRDNVSNTVRDKANIASWNLYTYMEDVEYLSMYAEEILEDTGKFIKKDISLIEKIPIGYRKLFLTLCDEDVKYEGFDQAKAGYLANIEDIARSMADRHSEIIAIYIATEDGLMLTYDENLSSTGQGIANTKYYDYKNTEWYRLGMKKSTLPVFTERYKDGFGRGDVVTCVAPFCYKNGDIAGCVALDVKALDIYTPIVDMGANETETAFIVDDKGTILMEKDGYHDADDMVTIFDSEKHPDLFEISDMIGKDEKNGAVFWTDPETMEEYLFAFAEIEYTNLKLVIKSPVSSVLGPIDNLDNEIQQNTELMNKSIENTIVSMLGLCFLLFFVLSIISVYIAGKVSYNLSDPLRVLSEDMKKISLGNLKYRTLVYTNDEIGSLAVSFNNMAESLEKYQADMKEAVSREEHTAMELSLATDIQAHMLPVNFSEFTEGRNFDLYATMTPAKEVAGDFYDFFRIDDDNIVLVIADVSGKGVPAALFMMISKILIKTNAFAESSPSELFRIVNNQLCDHNDENMFVTAWLAKIDINTGKVTAVNAGHEYPSLKQPKGRFELMEDVHGLPLGVVEGSRYKEYEFQLKEEASLFTYTDGVPEATDVGDEQFGTDRMLEALNKDPDAVPMQLLKEVKKKIDNFVGESEQFDDITMLGFCYKGNCRDEL